MTRPFKMNVYEALTAYGQIKSDVLNAIGYGADYDLISRVAGDTIGAKMVELTGEEQDKYIRNYSIALVEVLKPEYLKALRSSMRSRRSREKKTLSENKVTSMTIDVSLQDNINTLVKKMNGKETKGKRVFQVDVVRMAVLDLMDTLDDNDESSSNA